LLWTSWSQVLRLVIVFIMIGAFHVLFRRKFTRLTDCYQGVSEPPRGRKLWDFLFYFSFGIVIIESVRIAGVLTVFAFLILPASISAFYAQSWRGRIMAGLISGIIATLLGLHYSMNLDLTASPLIILFLGLILLISIPVRIFLKRRRAATAQR
jgi:zinc/manganese transport system permease protein